MTRRRLLGLDTESSPPLRGRYFFGDTEYRVALRFNERESIWTIAVSTLDGEAIVEGVRLATGRDALGNVPNKIGRLIAEDTGGNGVEATTLDAWRRGLRVVWDDDQEAS